MYLHAMWTVNRAVRKYKMGPDAYYRNYPVITIRAQLKLILAIFFSTGASKTAPVNNHSFQQISPTQQVQVHGNQIFRLSAKDLLPPPHLHWATTCNEPEAVSPQRTTSVSADKQRANLRDHTLKVLRSEGSKVLQGAWQEEVEQGFTLIIVGGGHFLILST